jgi:hypothetical protein
VSYALGTEIIDGDLILCDLHTFTPIRVGDHRKDFRGEEAMVTGGYAPRRPQSTGRIEVRFIPLLPAHTGEFYPSVFNAVWLNRTLTRRPNNEHNS